MIFKIIQFNSKQHQQMIDLCYKLLRKPLGLYFTPEQLAQDEKDFLIGCFNQSENELIGCCILSKVDSNTLQLRQMVVSDEFQAKGTGKFIVKYAEEVAKRNGFSKIILHARKSVVGFYEKSGYHLVGNEFIEVSIPHHQMEKTIA